MDVGLDVNRFFAAYKGKHISTLGKRGLVGTPSPSHLVLFVFQNSRASLAVTASSLFLI